MRAEGAPAGVLASESRDCSERLSLFAQLGAADGVRRVSWAHPEAVEQTPPTKAASRIELPETISWTKGALGPTRFAGMYEQALTGTHEMREAVNRAMDLEGHLEGRAKVAIQITHRPESPALLEDVLPV